MRSNTTTTGRREWPGRELPLAVFGENFTTVGLTEDLVHLGDQFSVGSALVIVTQPRVPCYKLGLRFQSDDMVKRFLESGRTGFYVAVGREGEVGAGDEIAEVSRDPHAYQSRKSSGCTWRKRSAPTTSLWYGEHCELPPCRRVGRTTSENGSRKWMFSPQHARTAVLSISQGRALTTSSVSGRREISVPHQEPAGRCRPR